MEAVKKLFGGYLIGVATVVAVWFIINSFFADSFNTLNVWYTLDVLMVMGLAIALIFNYTRKREEERGREPGEAVSRRHLEVNTAFYLTAGITILFLHNWFSLLAKVRTAWKVTTRPGSSGRWWTPCCRWSWA